MRKPKCFLMDEPLGALDTEMREAMIRELRALHDRLGATTVYVTHDQLEAMAMADMIAVMNNGVVEQVASPRDIYDRPASLRCRLHWLAADELPAVPRQPGKPARRRSGSASARLPFPRRARGCRKAISFSGSGPSMCVSPIAAPCGARSMGRVCTGTTQIVTVTTRYGALKARSPASVSFRTGENVGLDFRPDTLSIFDKASGRAIRTVLHEGGVHG